MSMGTVYTSYNSFEPDTYVTREQTMTLIHKTAKLVGLNKMGKSNKIAKDISQYKDGSTISEYAIDAVKWNLETGLIVGTSSNTISPKNFLTKEEMAIILYRFLESANFDYN